jgi:uncharacterized protein (TIGR02217 family)
MSNNAFPTLPGLAWSRLKTPTFATKVQTSVSLRELRASFTPYPQWKWTLTYDILRQNGSFTELSTLLGFFLARQGSFDSFLYTDPEDNAVSAQSFGVGDGTTTAFQLQRTFGGFTEPVYNVTGTPSIFKAGTLQATPANYSIGGSGLVTFTSAPAAGAALTWTGGYAWRVRFATDSYDFEEFASQLWQLRQLVFVSVLGS